MNVHCVLIAYALDISPLVHSLAGPDVTFHIFTHSARPDVLESCHRARLDANVRLYDYRTNRGLAKSWNQGIIAAQELAADVTIIANDDVQMDRNDLRVLARAAYENPEAGLIVCEGYNQGNWQILQHVIFAINPIALATVGFYDEQFVPIYFEDCDYSRRLALAGVPIHNAGPTGIQHESSASINTVPALSAQNQQTFPANHRYYVEKWGGEPGQERFLTPFNDPTLSLKIVAGDRSDPYPEHRRTDLEIVKL